MPYSWFYIVGRSYILAQIILRVFFYGILLSG